jgi:hypothetical protein
LKLKAENETLREWRKVSAQKDRRKKMTEKKAPKIVGCLVCGYRTDKAEEIKEFQEGNFFCCSK